VFSCANRNVTTICGLTRDEAEAEAEEEEVVEGEVVPIDNFPPSDTHCNYYGSPDRQQNQFVNKIFLSCLLFWCPVGKVHLGIGSLQSKSNAAPVLLYGCPSLVKL